MLGIHALYIEFIQKARVAQSYRTGTGERAVRLLDPRIRVLRYTHDSTFRVKTNQNDGLPQPQIVGKFSFLFIMIPFMCTWSIYGIFHSVCRPMLSLDNLIEERKKKRIGAALNRT